MKIIILGFHNQSEAAIETAMQRLTCLILEKQKNCEIENSMVPLQKDIIALTLQKAIESNPNLILSLGGSGIGDHDFVPEFTKKLCQREIPGIGEMMRHKTASLNDKAYISRYTAGICQNTLIVNFPGKTKVVEECFEVAGELILHITKKLSPNLKTDCAIEH